MSLTRYKDLFCFHFRAPKGAFLLYKSTLYSVIASIAKQSRLLQEQLRLPRRFTPRNDIILFSHASIAKQSLPTVVCHCERSEAISLKQTRLRRYVVPRNDIA